MIFFLYVIYLLSACSGTVDDHAIPYNNYIQEEVNENGNIDIPCYDNNYDPNESYSWFNNMFQNLPVITDEYEPVYIEE